jgi:hypothetical protein
LLQHSNVVRHGPLRLGLLLLSPQRRRLQRVVLLWLRVTVGTCRRISWSRVVTRWLLLLLLGELMYLLLLLHQPLLRSRHVLARWLLLLLLLLLRWLLLARLLLLRRWLVAHRLRLRRCGSRRLAGVRSRLRGRLRVRVLRFVLFNLDVVRSAAVLLVERLRASAEEARHQALFPLPVLAAGAATAGFRRQGLQLLLLRLEQLLISGALRGACTRGRRCGCCCYWSPLSGTW